MGTASWNTSIKGFDFTCCSFYRKLLIYRILFVMVVCAKDILLVQKNFMIYYIIYYKYFLYIVKIFICQYKFLKWCCKSNLFVICMHIISTNTYQFNKPFTVLLWYLWRCINFYLLLTFNLLLKLFQQLIVRDRVRESMYSYCFLSRIKTMIFNLSEDQMIKYTMP